MDVLVVSSKFPPEYAGSGLRAHETYLRLGEKFDINHDVLCNSVEFAEPKTYTLDGVTVRRVVNQFGHRISQFAPEGTAFRLANAIRYHAEARRTRKFLDNHDYDVIHTFGNSASTAQAIIWSIQRNVPLVMEIVNNNTTPYQYLPLTARGPFRHLPGMEDYIDYTFDEQAAIVAISSKLGKVCAEHGYERNVWVRPNPVDEKRFAGVDIGERKDPSNLTPFDADDTILLYVASYRPIKNHRFLLDVLSELPEEYKLVLAGPIDDGGLNESVYTSVLDELREKIERLDLSGRVDVVVDFVDMAEYLEIADVFCHPSTDEAMGTPILESIMAGVPVVANANQQPFREYVNDGQNGFTRVMEPQEWAEAVESAAEFDKEQCKRAADAMAKQASSAVIDRKYHQILHALANSKPGEEIAVDKI